MASIGVAIQRSIPRCRKTSLRWGKARLQYFWINKGPWSFLDNFRCFFCIPAEKAQGGKFFYPET